MENKTTIKFILFTLVGCLTAYIGYSQDTTAVDSTMSTSIMDSNLMYYVLCALGAIYEVGVRVVPTLGNYSILSMAYKLIQFIIPNIKKQGGRHQ